jgi:OmpA-OmpF porin, OOP family
MNSLQHRFGPLVKNGIEANRISAIGNGSDGTQDADKARRVETTDNHQ